MIKKLLCFYFFISWGNISLANETTYHIKWTTKLPVEVKTLRGMEGLRSRVSEKGIYSKEISLPVKEVLTEGKVTLNQEEEAFLYALIKNVGQKTIRFSVAPHSTNPASSALGFKFNCLCNGHIYEVKPGEIWYKIMSLKNSTLPKGKDVVLEHNIFEVTGKQTLNAHHHH